MNQYHGFDFELQLPYEIKNIFQPIVFTKRSYRYLLYTLCSNRFVIRGFIYFYRQISYASARSRFLHCPKFQGISDCLSHVIDFKIMFPLHAELGHPPGKSFAITIDKGRLHEYLENRKKKTKYLKI